MSAGYQYVRGVHLLMQVNQNVPGCAAAGTNNGCRPNAAYANNNQYSSVASSVYHGLHVSLVQRAARLAQRAGQLHAVVVEEQCGRDVLQLADRSFDLSKDWGRSDDDQRHRLALTGAINTPTAPARTVWERVGHGFQLSGLLQAYSALPFNITSGVTTVQGTAGRPVVDGAFIPRNAGVGSDFLSLGMRVTRTFPVGRARFEALARRLQPHEPAQRRDAQHELRRGRVLRRTLAPASGCRRRWGIRARSSSRCARGSERRHQGDDDLDGVRARAAAVAGVRARSTRPGLAPVQV